MTGLLEKALKRVEALSEKEQDDISLMTAPTVARELWAPTIDGFLWARSLRSQNGRIADREPRP
jgi:hypothetical protein